LQDYQVLVTRLQSLPSLINITIANMRRNTDTILALPEPSAKRSLQQIREFLSENPEEILLNPFLVHLPARAKLFSAKDVRMLLMRARAAARDAAIAALVRLEDFLANEYLPKRSLGVGHHHFKLCLRHHSRLDQATPNLVTETVSTAFFEEPFSNVSQLTHLESEKEVLEFTRDALTKFIPLVAVKRAMVIKDDYLPSWTGVLK